MNDETERLSKLSLTELHDACTCDPDDECSMCLACFVAGAIAAGIPRSVIAGKSKLSDHFSEAYIKSQCSKESP